MRDTGDQLWGTTAYTFTHPQDLIPLLGHGAEMTLGAMLMAAGAGGELAGGAMDLTVVGGVVGVPLGAVSAAAIAGGAGLGLHGAHGMTDDLTKVYNEAQEAAGGEGQQAAGSPAPGSLGQRLDSAPVYKGSRLPTEGGPPGGLMVKRAPDGRVTNYTEYDADGFAIKRVDLTGTSHGGLGTPHTLEYQRNVDPTGRTHVGAASKGRVRPATPSEVP